MDRLSGTISTPHADRESKMALTLGWHVPMCVPFTILWLIYFSGFALLFFRVRVLLDGWFRRKLSFSSLVKSHSIRRHNNNTGLVHNK